MASLLEIRDLSLDFTLGADRLHALSGIGFDVPRGTSVAVVGESGSGKTVSALAALGLLPGNARITGGSIRFEGRELIGADDEALRALRGRRMAMVFQNASAALNPLYPVGDQIADVARLRLGLPRRAAYARALETLAATGIPDTGHRARNYPHEFSGGMAQRAMIAMALVCRPDLIIADEPTSGLDVTIQVQVIELIRSVVAELGAALLIITHDIGLVPAIADRVVVMYAGTVMETGPAAAVLARPASPYTERLLACFEEGDGDAMPTIPGRVPDLRSRWTGCVFAPRCPRAETVCRELPPPSVEVEPGHRSTCHFA